MHQSVIDIWHTFSEPLEGRVHWMYLDILGLVTTGVGNLIDPIDLALKLPWKRPDGTAATVDEVRRDWHALKARQDLRSKHFKYASPITTVRLTDEDIDAIVLEKLRSNERELRRYFPHFDEWPADAQLGVLSMAWAMGPAFPQKFPTFTRCAQAQDWIAARGACKIRTEGNPGVVPRNRANERCFENAANVLEAGLPLERLHWPWDAPRFAPVTTAPARPEPLAGGVSVAGSVVSAALREMGDDGGPEGTA